MDEKKWAIVELLGRRKFAGSIERGQMLKVTVPATPNGPGFDKEFGWGSVYGITPCSESVARRAAEVLAAQPHPYTESEAVPVYDENCLNLISDPMQEVDLGAARCGHLLEKWEREDQLRIAGSV